MHICIENLQNDMKNHQTKSETGKFLGFRIKYEYEQLRKWAIIKICKTLKTDTNYLPYIDAVPPKRKHEANIIILGGILSS